MIQSSAIMLDLVCSRCGSESVYKDEDELTTEAVCLACGNRVTISKKKPNLTELSACDIPSKPTRRIRGISARESRRIYRNSPAGQAAWNRYRYSELFYEAHARHRETETYKETQRRFKQKRELFRFLLSRNSTLEFTCPLKLFWKGPNGEVYNNQEMCDVDGKDCNLSCIEKELTWEAFDIPTSYVVYTCPLGLFRQRNNGESLNNQEKCNLDSGNCSFNCLEGA